jgi:acyl-CoA thioester hydrolase
MSEVFKTRFRAGWGTMDANAHMANTGFLDAAVDCRMTYFMDQGFPASEFRRLQLGPVVRRDVVQYFREIRLLEPFDVTLGLSGLSADGSRFRLFNEFLREDGQRAATVTSDGGWLDLSERRVARPPPRVLARLQCLTRSDDFETFDTRVSDE